MSSRPSLPARVLRAPAVHFLVLGALAFAAVQGLTSLGALPSNGDRPTLVVPASRIAEARRDFETRHGRTATAVDLAAIERAAVDEAILFDHAVALGLDRDPVIERRLAQIADFVVAGLDLDTHVEPGTTPMPAAATLSERASAARALGLHASDPVTRNLLVDRARRLVRAAVLIREPSDEALREHWREHPERWLEPETTRIDFAPSLGDKVAGAKRGEAVALATLPDREIARRLGRDFADALADAPEGTWHGPLPSREGPQWVFVHERRPAAPAPFEAVRGQVRDEVRQQLADRWLETRLDLLREEYTIVVEPTPIETLLADASTPSRSPS